MYGSSLILVTRMPRDSRIAAREAAAMPFPRLETTPPGTKTYFVMNAACGVDGGVYRKRPDASNRPSAFHRSRHLPPLQVPCPRAHPKEKAFSTPQRPSVSPPHQH